MRVKKLLSAPFVITIVQKKITFTNHITSNHIENQYYKRDFSTSKWLYEEQDMMIKTKIDQTNDHTSKKKTTVN